MERIVLKHLSGSKANQVEEFPLNHVKELILGRDPSSTVKYDPDRDDLVGRQHAKITQDPNDPSQFIISDMNSRNGTFVNGENIGQRQVRDFAEADGETGWHVLKEGDELRIGSTTLRVDVSTRPVRETVGRGAAPWSLFRLWAKSASPC